MVVLILLFIVLVYQCGPDEGILLTVLNGTTHEYSWDGGSVNYLIVKKYSNSVAVCAVITPKSDGIYSPVKHGEIPEGAVLYNDPLKIGTIDSTVYNKPLEIGEKYYVQVWKYRKYAVGEADFIYQE
ncbi:hypothetical protein ACFL4T_08880 [candidate division KSB1 bacterium]